MHPLLGGQLISCKDKSGSKKKQHGSRKKMMGRRGRGRGNYKQERVNAA